VYRRVRASNARALGGPGTRMTAEKRVGGGYVEVVFMMQTDEGD